MGAKDMTEKTLEAMNDVFADIVNGLLFRWRPVLREEDLTDAQPFSMYKADGEIHEQERDVSKYWLAKDGNQINVRIAFLGIENQTDYDRDMPLRVIGYDGAQYRAELAESERYPVLTLVLHFGSSRWGKNRTIYDAVCVPEEFSPFVSDYRINVFEIAFLAEEAINYFHSDFKVVADYFVHSRKNPDYRPTDPVKFKHVDEVLKLMSALTRDDRYAEMLNEEGGKPENMCEVLDRAEERGMIKGREEGRLEGLREGRLEGRQEEREKAMIREIKAIKTIMNLQKMSAAEAMDLLDIPSDERGEYQEKLFSSD